MNNNTIIGQGGCGACIHRQDSHNCRGRTGCKPACSKHSVAIARRQNNTIAKTAGLCLLMSSLLVHGQIDPGCLPAAVKHAPAKQDSHALVSHSQVSEPILDPAYYQSTDNPFRGD
jgi:hypothetical protein